MFAIIRTGGKQYKVKANDILKIEKIDLEQGSPIVLEQVLLISDGKKTQVGKPFIKNATVRAEVLEHKKDDKIIIFKKKRRQNYRRKKGHRQLQTVIKISGIYDNGIELAVEKKPLEASKKKSAEKKTVTKKKIVAEKKAVIKKKVVTEKKAPAK